MRGASHTTRLIRGLRPRRDTHRRAITAAVAPLAPAPAVIVMRLRPREGDGGGATGAEVSGTTSAQRVRRRHAERGLTIVPPSITVIIAGQTRPIVEQCPTWRRSTCRFGAAASISRLGHQAPSIGASSAPAGAARGRAIGRRHAGEDRHADGLMPVRPGDHTFAHVQALVDDLVTVEDAMIAKAVVWLFRHAKLVVEPSGAATVAAALADTAPRAGHDGITVAVLSGGNIALDWRRRRGRRLPALGRGSGPRLAAGRVGARGDAAARGRVGVTRATTPWRIRRVGSANRRPYQSSISP
jgi:threonine dehydratase